MKGIIKKDIGRGIFEDYYIDYNNDRFRFARANKRTIIFRSNETGKEIKILIYPCWSYIDNYVEKEVNVIEGGKS